EEGRCGQTLKDDYILLKKRGILERELADLADLRETVPLWNDLKTKVDDARQAVLFQGQIAVALAKLAQTPEQIAGFKGPLNALLGEGNVLLEPEGAIPQSGIALREKLKQLETRSAHLTAVGQFTEQTVAANSELSLNELKQNCELMVVSEPRLRAWCAWRKIRDEAFAVGLAPIVEAMEKG
ncbi:hypothetical protein, partial [Pseudomonas simiae]